MTVQELIDELNKIQDKTLIVGKAHPASRDWGEYIQEYKSLKIKTAGNLRIDGKYTMDTFLELE